MCPLWHPHVKTMTLYGVAVGFPRRLLNDGEELIVDTRPHWWFLAGPFVFLTAAIAGAVAAMVESAPAWAAWLAIAALAAGGLWVLVRYVRWSSKTFALTTSRLVVRSGFLSRRGREIPLAALSDISYRQSIFERIIGAGDVLVESAGRDGQEVFPDLPHPARIHNEIYRQLDALHRSAAVPPSHPAQPSGSIIDQIDRLDQLRRRGVITDAEFAAKKAQLLDRL